MRRRSHPQSPVQSVTHQWWAPFLLAFLAALAFWTWQQWRIQDEPPEKGKPTRTGEPEIPNLPLAVPPKANLVRYFSTDDYPMEAIRNEEQGTTAFKLLIDRHGRVVRCDVTSSSGSAALDKATCDIVRRRARYVPARDSSGNPVPGTDTGRIRWELPED